jgi:hypothetical protein
MEFFGKCERKRLLIRPRHRWEDNKVDHGKIDLGGVVSSGSGSGLMVGFCEHSSES